MSASVNRLFQSRVIRNLSAVTVHKGLQIAGQAVMVALIPRMLGAENYGRFAFILSLTYLGQMLADFGTLDVLGRFTPELGRDTARRLYLQLLTFKAGVSLLAAVVTAAAALALSGWMTPVWAVLSGLIVALHIVARIPFQYALGLNRIGVWMAEQSGRQWLLLGLLLALLPLMGFTGAVLSVMVMELVFAVAGVWGWLREEWQADLLGVDWTFLRPYLRFGASFFLSNLTAVALYRSGPVLVELLTGQSAQTGYFNLGLGLFLMVYITLSQFAQSFIPTLSGFYANGESNQLQSWAENFAWYGWLVGWAGAAAAWLLADRLVPLVFGPAFVPAAATLRWISLAIPPVAVLWTASAVATAAGRGRARFIASLAALVVFVLALLWLTPRAAAVGAAQALGLAMVVNMVVLAVYLRPVFRLNWFRLVTTGLAAGGLLGAVHFLF